MSDGTVLCVGEDDDGSSSTRRSGKANDTSSGTGGAGGGYPSSMPPRVVDAFRYFDRNGSGYLDYRELRDALFMMGIDSTLESAASSTRSRRGRRRWGCGDGS